MIDPQPAPQAAAPGLDAAPSSRAVAFDPQELLSRLWKQNLPIMRHRIECLEAAVQQALAGPLPPELQVQASDIAHKLAGSLGMFGYPAGTDIARKMEAVLEADAPLDPAIFASLTSELRAVLQL